MKTFTAVLSGSRGGREAVACTSVLPGAVTFPALSLEGDVPERRTSSVLPWCARYDSRLGKWRTDRQAPVGCAPNVLFICSSLAMLVRLGRLSKR